MFVYVYVCSKYQMNISSRYYKYCTVYTYYLYSLCISKFLTLDNIPKKVHNVCKYIILYSYEVYISHVFTLSRSLSLNLIFSNSFIHRLLHSIHSKLTTPKTRSKGGRVHGRCPSSLCGYRHIHKAHSYTLHRQSLPSAPLRTWPSRAKSTWSW